MANNSTYPEWKRQLLKYITADNLVAVALWATAMVVVIVARK